ncbi:MAG: hypothetical protein AABY07_03170 [Nanoarchaeota archaeon]|mgnify:FL=1
MNQSLERSIEQEELEFIGPDFNFNGYCNARYRMRNTSVRLGDIEVPTRVEALNTRGEWQQFPVVFIHYGTYEAMKNNDGQLVMFLPGGKYTSKPYSPITDRELYQQAKKLGLTMGKQSGIQSIVKEEE